MSEQVNELEARAREMEEKWRQSETKLRQAEGKLQAQSGSNEEASRLVVRFVSTYIGVPFLGCQRAGDWQP